MYTCHKCGFKYDTHTFDTCPHCGLVGPMPVFCDGCGAKLEPDDLICPECKKQTAFGKKFDKALGKA